MNKQVLLFGALMVAILVCAVVASYGYYSTITRLKNENTSLREQLDQSASQLRDVENQTRRLDAELNKTNAQVTELQRKITDLEANITKLQGELEDKALQKGAITIGLSFLWNPALDIDLAYLRQAVDWMNRVQWHDFGVYFFIYHYGPQNFVPSTLNCNELIHNPISALSWADQAWHLFPATDIPVLVVRMHRDSWGAVGYWGCVPYYKTRVVVVDSERFEAGTQHSVASYGATIITHEVLHELGFGREVERLNQQDMVIPVSWRSDVASRAKRFQMPMP